MHSDRAALHYNTLTLQCIALHARRHMPTQFCQTQCAAISHLALAPGMPWLPTFCQRRWQGRSGAEELGAVSHLALAPGKAAAAATWRALPIYKGPVPGVPSPFPTCTNPCRCCFYTKARFLPDGTWSTGWRRHHGDWAWSEGRPAHGPEQHLAATEGRLGPILDLEPQCKCCYYRFVPIRTESLTSKSIDACPGWYGGAYKKGKLSLLWCDHGAPHKAGFTWEDTGLAEVAPGAPGFPNIAARVRAKGRAAIPYLEPMVTPQWHPMAKLEMAREDETVPGDAAAVPLG